MKRSNLVLATAFAFVAGCAAGGASGPPPGAAAPPSSEAPLGSPFADRRGSLNALAFPLLLDRGDYRLGTTVQFGRMPSVADLDDAVRLPALQHIVISLPAWPEEYAPLEVLNHVPEEVDVLVVLPGYPPTRGAANAWNLVEAKLRLVIVVNGPPPSAAIISDLNALRSLERVIAQMDEPDRGGFERLQRPLSYRVLRD